MIKTSAFSSTSSSDMRFGSVVTKGSVHKTLADL